MRETHAKPASEILFVRTGQEPFEQLPYLVHVLADHCRKRGPGVGVTSTSREQVLATEKQLAAPGVVATALEPDTAEDAAPMLVARAQPDSMLVH